MYRMHIFWGLFAALTLTSKVEAVDSLLSFGDSYFDTGAGNAVCQQDGVPLVSPTPPYVDGRHSNGLIWIDYTSQALGLPLTNYAVAGAETGARNVNSPPPPSPSNPIGGLFQQLERFEATGKKIRKNQLVVVDGAGNNFLALVPTELNPAAVSTATTQALTDLGTVVLPTLQKLGAEKIVMWNLGDLSMLPLFNNPIFGPLDSAPVRELMHEASVGFNAGLIPVVKELNTKHAHFLEGVKDNPQIFIFDAYSAFNTIAAELVAEGETLSDFTILATYGGPYIRITPPNVDPNSLPFYDQVHPTTVTWALFSKITSAYFDTLINAPLFVAAQSDLALETSSSHRDLVDNHFRTLHEERYIYDSCVDNDDDCCDSFMDGCCGRDCFQVYADAEAKWGSIDTRRGHFGQNYDTQLGLIGLDYRLSQEITVGTSFTYQRSHARIRERQGSFNLDDYCPTVYTSYFGPCYFADIAASVHCYQFRDIKRNIPFLDRRAKGHTSGYAPEVYVDMGYVGSLNCLTYIPLIGVSYQDLTIDRYHTHGAGFLDLNVHRQRQRSCLLKAGGQLFYKLWNECTLAFAEVFYKREFLRNRHRHSMTFRDSVDNAVLYNFTSPRRRNIIEYSFGFSAKFDNLVGNISYLGDTNFTNYSNAVRAQLDYAF